MEKVLNEAIEKAKYHGLPMVVYIDTELDKPYFCLLETYKPRYGEIVYVVLSDGSFEKIGTANVHHG